MTDKVSTLRLQDAWRECERNIYHLCRALTSLDPILPMTGERFEHLTDAQVQTVDQFILRFTMICVLAIDAIESFHHHINLRRLEMRTTLDIDEDVLAAAKELGRSQNLSAGQVVSQLLRKALTGQAGRDTALAEQASGSQTIAGFRPFSAGQVIVTNEAVNRLREAEGV
jgi:Arc/MetJ family transcription regulator